MSTGNNENMKQDIEANFDKLDLYKTILERELEHLSRMSKEQLH